MKLKSAQVVHFRNVLDSSVVAIQDNITCLVGKNESGKTSFLQALHALNPAVEKPLDVMDYPAWLSKMHQLEGRNLAEERPIRVSFELDENECAELEAKFGPSVVRVSAFTVARKYDGAMNVDIEFDEAAWVSAFMQRHCAGLTDIPAAQTAAELADALKQRSAAPPSDADESAHGRMADALACLQEQCGDGFDIEARVRSWIGDRIPKFLYVGRYHTLQGRIEIQKIAGANYEQLGPEEQIAKALLDLSMVDTQLAMGSDYERRKRELNDTANALTQEILEYWTQNTDIRVEIDFDQERQGTNGVIVRHLHVRLFDSLHMISLPFGERSSGFQWFFSFLCAFSRYRMSGQPVILLLDEPALGLHARAQRDFLRYIEEKLAPRCQVVYTTHSPFMVQPKRLDRVRLVEDKGRKQGSVVSADVMSTDADTVFPLQGALGYDLAQSLFVGPYNLIVEGTSDLTYLQVLSDYLKAKGRTGLDERCTIVPVGGAEKIATFAALLGTHVDATVLIDSTKQGNQRLGDLLRQGSLTKSRVIGVAEFTGTREADIEDLFDVVEYLKLFNDAFGTSFEAEDLKGADPVVRRLARAQGVQRYDHGKPAEVILRKSSDVLDKLSLETLGRFEALFARINGTLPDNVAS